MSEAVVTTITKAVTAQLETIKNNLSLPFVVKRVYIPDYNKDTAKGVTVYVSAGEIVAEPNTRGLTDYVYEILVGVLSPAKMSEPNGVDALIYLVEQIQGYLAETDIALEDVALEECTNSLPYVPDLLQDRGTFLSLISIRYFTQR